MAHVELLMSAAARLSSMPQPWLRCPCTSASRKRPGCFCSWTPGVIHKPCLEREQLERWASPPPEPPVVALVTAALEATLLEYQASRLELELGLAHRWVAKQGPACRSIRSCSRQGRRKTCGSGMQGGQMHAPEPAAGPAASAQPWGRQARKRAWKRAALQDLGNPVSHELQA